MPRSSGALFFIGHAIRRGRDAPADDPSQHDDRKQVWQPSEEVIIDTWVSLLETSQKCTQVSRRRGETNRYTKRLRSHEEECAPKGAQRCPASKNHGSQGNEPPAGGHVILEGAGGFEGKICPSQARKQASHQNVTIAKLDDIDADSVCCLRVLPHSTRPQTPTGTEEQDLDDYHQYDNRHGNGTHSHEHLEQPAYDGQVHKPVRRLERIECACTV